MLVNVGEEDGRKPVPSGDCERGAGRSGATSGLRKAEVAGCRREDGRGLLPPRAGAQDRRGPCGLIAVRREGASVG